MNARRLVVMNVVIILVIIIAGFLGYYFYNQSTLYLTTDDAQVSGQQIVIGAPATGKLMNWTGSTGSNVGSGNTIGQIDVNGKLMNVSMPQSGTIVQNDAVDNEIVAAGTPLAYAYNMNNLYVTANIKETDIQKVKVGDAVDVYADAFPGTSITGTVSQIGLATASTFSLMPTTSTNADFTKVTQVVPVKITLQSIPSGLVPGMSVRVRIHK